MKSYIKYSLFTILLIYLPFGVVAQSSTILFSDVESEASFTGRFDFGETEFAMRTNEESVELMLTEDGMAIQFSDKFFDRLEKEIEEEGDEENAFANAIKAAVTSGVTSLLDRAMVVPYSEIDNAFYSNGRLYIYNQNGEEIFRNLDIDDIPVMEDFPRREAGRFVLQLTKKLP